jgi:formylglycine-generating enzyme required for sulfatase activity
MENKGLALVEIGKDIGKGVLNLGKSIWDFGMGAYDVYNNRDLTKSGQALQQLQNEQRLFVQLYEGRQTRQLQDKHHQERQLTQLLEANRNRDHQDRLHKERLLAQLKESEVSRDFQIQMLALQRQYQLEIKELDRQWTLELRQKDRLLQLELLKVMRQNQHYPLYPGVESILTNPLTEGLQKVHLIFSPPNIQHDKVRHEDGFPKNEQPLTDALHTLAQQYQQSGRPVRLEGGAWVSKVYHGQAAAGAIFEQMKTENVILLEASVEEAHYFIKMGSWWANASEYQFQNVLSFSWVTALNEIVKKRVLDWQANQQKHQLSDTFLENRLGKDTFLAYKQSLQLIVDEEDMVTFGFASATRLHTPIDNDKEQLTQLLNLYHQIFIGIALDDAFLLSPTPHLRKKPLLPTLLPHLLKNMPNNERFLTETLMPHYQKVYGLLMDTEKALAADLYIDLANVLLALNQTEPADTVLEKAFQSLWLLGQQRSDSVIAPEQWIADHQAKVAKEDFDWLSMVYEKVETMPTLRFKALLPALRALRIEAANLKVLFQAETIQREAEAKSAKEATERAAEQKRQEAAERIRKAYEPEMVLVEGGTFQMGSDVYSGEKPIHQVTLSTFSMGKYPITQSQWQKVMGSNPSHFKGDDLPVEQVSWEDAQQFINKLNSMTGKTYRLPTEAQWEFAARGGTKSKGYEYSGSNNANEVAWYDDNSGKKTQLVGQKAANELGIFDMSGNVWEWCSDWYGDYSSATVTNPTGAATGVFRVCSRSESVLLHAHVS